MNAGMMMTYVKAELPSYGMVWFDLQAMTRNVLSFGNIAKQYPISYLQELDTFQVQLGNHINILAAIRLIIYTSWKDINLEESLQNLPHSKKIFPKYQQHHMLKLLKRTPSFSLPRRYPQPAWLSGCYMHWVILQWSSSRPSLEPM